MESIVIAMGGSVLLSEDADESFYYKLEKLISKTQKKYKIYVVVGGGKTARFYIKLGRKLGFAEEELDRIGISITRINAKFLTDVLKISNKNIPETIDEASKNTNQTIIMGGTTSGHSTDMVATELAEKVDAVKLIIATNVDGVYDKDPNKFDDAVKYEEIPVDELVKIYGTKWESAGKNTVIDGPALKIIQRSKITTLVCNGKKFDDLEKAIFGKNFNGTRIKN